MKKHRVKVVLLYNLSERLLKGEEKDILAEDAIIEEIGAVEGAVRSLVRFGQGSDGLGRGRTKTTD